MGIAATVAAQKQQGIVGPHAGDHRSMFQQILAAMPPPGGASSTPAQTPPPSGNDGYVSPTSYSTPGGPGDPGGAPTAASLGIADTPGVEAALKAGPHSHQPLALMQRPATPIQDIAGALYKHLPVSDASWAKIGFGHGGAAPGSAPASTTPTANPGAFSGIPQSSLPYVMRQFTTLPRPG